MGYDVIAAVVPAESPCALNANVLGNADFQGEKYNKGGVNKDSKCARRTRVPASNYNCYSSRVNYSNLIAIV